MKKLYLFAFISGLAAAIVIAGCTNAFSPSESHDSGNGNVSVSLAAGGTSAKMVSPSTLNFDLYEFKFTNEISGYNETFSEGKNAGGTFNFTVPTGPGYMLNVKAYKGAGEGKVLAAEGDSSVFTVGVSTPVTVKLTGNLGEGTGTFSFTIQFPAGAQAERMALVIGENNEISLLEGAEGFLADGVYTISNSIDVQSGWYWLELELSNGEKVVIAGDLVSIFSNTTSFYGTSSEPKVFVAEDFEDVSGYTGVRVYNWRGFNVEGASTFYNNDRTSRDFNGSYYNYDRSRAVGTLYLEPFEGPDGNEWQGEVLKLAPPTEKSPSEYQNYKPWPGGYESWTVAMTRQVSPGTYILSIKVWVEESPNEGEGEGKGVQVVWFNTAAWDAIAGNPYGDITRGQWLDIEGVFTANSTTEICLMARYNPDVCGLRNATIYIKDLVFELYSERLRITPPSFSLLEGKTRELSANGEVAGWSSSNESVATVNSNGVFTAVAAGTATITAYSNESPPREATSTVTVTAKGARYIALSFDDGPDDAYTFRVLDILHDYGARATFFPIGREARKYSAAANAVIAAGMEIASHTIGHNYYGGSSFADARAGMISNQIAIEEVTGVVPTLFRAPGLNYGNDDFYAEKQYTGPIVDAARSLGLPIIDASGHQDGNFDWKQENAAAIVEHIKHLAKDWGILLVHDGLDGRPASACENLVQALPVFLDWLINEEGYAVVGVHELAKIRGIELIPGKIYYDFANEPLSVRVESVAVTPNAITLNDTPQQLSAVITPSNAGAQVYWYSDNNSVVDVDANGVVNAVAPGATYITAIAGSKYARVKVTVDVTMNIVTKTTWDAFDIAGTDHTNYYGARAAGEELSGYRPGDGYSYDNVLKLSPSGDWYYYADKGSLAMVFNVPYAGTYRLSYDVLVESERDDINLVWYAYDPGSPNNNNGWPMLNQPSNEYAGVETGKWLTIEGPACFISLANAPFGILGYNSSQNNGLRNATIYIKNLKLELEGAEYLVIDIPSTKTQVAIDNATLTTWNAFDIAGTNHDRYVGAKAVGEELPNFRPGDGYSYDNVLKVSPPINQGSPTEGYYYHTGQGSLAMVYTVQQSGKYRLTYDVWVESEDPDINLIWYICAPDGSWPMLNSDGVNYVEKGKWLHRTGSEDIEAGAPFGLLGYNSGMGKGLKDATIYLKNLTLELIGAENLVIDIPSNKTETPKDPVIILQWKEDGSLIEAEAITVSKGGTVRITAPSGLPMYQWFVGQEFYTGVETLVFDSTNRAAGTYTIGFYSGTKFGGDAVKITVTN